MALTDRFGRPFPTTTNPERPSASVPNGQAAGPASPATQNPNAAGNNALADRQSASPSGSLPPKSIQIPCVGITDASVVERFISDLKIALKHARRGGGAYTAFLKDRNDVPRFAIQIHLRMNPEAAKDLYERVSGSAPLRKAVLSIVKDENKPATQEDAAPAAQEILNNASNNSAPPASGDGHPSN